MSSRHSKWRPSTAAKPSHLTVTAPANPNNSLAALQGANLAFAATSPSPTASVQHLTAQYEPKSSISAGEGPAQAAESLARSPSRGRHMSPRDARPVPVRGLSNVSNPPPPVLNRATSMIAARLASANSSPVRTTQQQSSPARDIQLIRSISSSDVESATRKIPRSSAEKEPPVPALDLDKIPKLNKMSITSTTSQSHTQSANAATRTSKRQVTQSVAPSTNKNVENRSVAKPAPPPSRRAQTKAPLKPNLTGPQAHGGLSRDEIVNRMADAMVASSLASSRPTSPSKKHKRPGALRRSSSAHELFQIPPAETEPVPSVPRQFRQTLRKTSPDDDEEVVVTKRGRRHLVRKHPNMHHEGDRKRWRDKVTEPERKRYEGVFAANRGLLLKENHPDDSPSRQIDPNSEANQVANLVVRDIWERSRLPSQTLERIYDLVASEDCRQLNREQFVVGLWLIDQQLKGRKLPFEVSDSVWASVRHSQGLKVKNVAR